ncbi:hypothetical protein [Streptomyces sp. NPDC049881]
MDTSKRSTWRKFEDAVAWAVERLGRAGIGIADVRMPLTDFRTAAP